MDLLWATTGAFASLQLVLTALILRRLLRVEGRPLVNEIVLLALVLIAGLWVAHPYVHDGQIGAGDSYHYGLQVADFVTQIRAGIFPVLIGQSEYAFNGNVHTLRTAPYFTHLAGLLDTLTLRQLSFFALQNLTAVLSITGAGLTACLCARLLAPGCRWLGLALGILYASCPALAAALFGSDMFATVMTAPWLPVFFLGLARSLRDLDDTPGLFISVFSLAVIWYAHPAIGVWLSVFLFGVQAWRLITVGGARGNVLRPFLGAAGIALLLAYLLYSVESLALGYHAGNLREDALSSLMNSVVDSFPAAFLPVSLAGGNGNFQIGYALGLLLVAGLAAGWRANYAIKGMAIMAAFLVIATVPVPWVTPKLWTLVPSRILDVTNVWPMQRFYLILSALTVIAFALAAGRIPAGRGRIPWITAFALATGCAWSITEMTKFHRIVARSIASTEESRTTIRPENVTLTRSSYLLFGEPPPSFSHGWVDPEFASRLRDEAMAPLTDNAAALLAARGGLTPLLPLTPMVNDTPLVIPPGDDVLLRFDFSDPASRGVIRLLGGGIQRAYLLPSSGEKRAFGANDEGSRTLTIRAVPDRERTVVLSTTAPGVSVEALAFDSEQTPVQVDSLTPYTASVNAPQPAYLETPQVFVPGYTASINGNPVSIERTPSGLVSVPVPAGPSHVVISYPGPRLLRPLWFVSAVGFFAVPFLAFAVARKRPRAGSTLQITREALREHNMRMRWRCATRLKKRVIVFAPAVAIAAVMGFLSLKTARADLSAFGSIRITVELPEGGGPQPLIVSGRTGAADCLYLIPEGNGRFRFGIDHWGIGGPVSEPIQLAPARYHTIELTSGGLYPASHPDYARFAAEVERTDRAPIGPLRLVVDGRIVFDLRHPFHPAAPDEVALGINSIGLSACGPSFEGRIAKTERFLPDFFADPRDPGPVTSPPSFP